MFQHTDRLVISIFMKGKIIRFIAEQSNIIHGKGTAGGIKIQNIQLSCICLKNIVSVHNRMYRLCWKNCSRA